MKFYYVYKHYDKKGNLLYVGCTNDIISRTRGHSLASYWYNNIHKIIIEKYKTKEDALNAETDAIIEGQPKINKVKLRPIPVYMEKPMVKIKRQERLSKKKSRYEEMVSLRKSGLSYLEIGKKYGVSRQAVHFFLSRNYLDK